MGVTGVNVYVNGGTYIFTGV